MAFEAGPWKDLRAAAMRMAFWPFRVAAARATMRALGAMDGRELADIGLTRSDLRDASALAPDCDPTELLASRSHERRRDAARAPAPPRGGGGRRAGDPGAGGVLTGIRETNAAC